MTNSETQCAPPPVTLLSLQDIRRKLQDRRLSVIARAVNIRHGTLIDIREGRTSNPSYDTVYRLCEYFSGE